jgi:aldose 1-epimerase
MPIAPSGEQYEIRSGEQRAVIVEVGGGIRLYEAAGRPVLEPYAVDRMRDAAHGAPLVPWPNRLADGRYAWDGEDLQLALTEPATRTAIHGLLLWRPWRASEHDGDRVVMAARLHPQQGYPFALDVEVAYRLTPEGLEVTTTATNIGDRACPYGDGQHPYLSPADARIDDCTLELPGATRILTDDERQLPTGREAVAGTPYDFRAGRRLGDLQIDHAFTDLERDAGGRAWTRLRGPDGATAELWVDAHHPFLEVFTGDKLPPGRARRGLGIEPMTCPPNAFATGDSVLRLEPGSSVATTWGARLT